MKKSLLNLLFAAAAVCCLPAATASDTVRDFELDHVKIPVYQKNKLDFIIFADNGQRHGMLISGKNTLIDRLLENADVDRIPDGWQEKIYPLKASLPEVLKFWQKRYTSSSAVIFTPECTFDRKTNIVSGTDDVNMRTPSFDLDGIGFRADLSKKEIEINSDVNIIARRDDSDPREIIPGRLAMPVKYETVFASGDSLRLDMVHNEIMLIGSVKVIDGATTLTCDRLTIFLKDKKDADASARTAGSGNDFGDSSTMLKGVSRILADGDVVLTRRLENANSPDQKQNAWCEHLEYEFDSGRIILTGEDELPKLAQDNYTLTGERIELLRFSRKAFVKNKCRITEYETANNKKTVVRTIDSDNGDFDGVANLNIFTGNVLLSDSEATLSCDQMRVFLKPAADKKKIKKEKAEFSPVSGTQELDRILCDGNLRIVSKVKAPAKPGMPPQQPSVIVSKRCELDYPADKLIFYEQVKVTNKGDTLDCDRLDLFLKDSQYPKDSKKGKSNVALGGRSTSDKTLTKVIASGNVHMKDQKSDLTTELMTMNFKELPRDFRSEPGMFTASNVQLIRIACDGSVVANSFPGTTPAANGRKRTLKAEHAMSDMIKHRSEFHKQVFLQEDGNELSCKDMYVFTGVAPVATAPKATAVPAVDDPDADPFALDITENAAPSRIALSDGIDLERIVCKNDVVLTNKDKSGKAIHACGDTAVYTVKTGDVVITAEPPNRPYIRRDGRRQYSDVIKGNLHTEELQGDGNVQLVPEK